MTEYESKKIIRPADMESYYEEWGFSPAVEYQGLIFVSGCTGTKKGGIVPEGIIAQTEVAFLKIKNSLDAAGVTFSDIIEMTTYHVGLSDHFDEFRRIKDQFIPAPFPAWTAIGVCELASAGALVEVRVIAAKNTGVREIKHINSTKSPIPSGAYSQALEVSNANRVLYISGQIPQSADGGVPELFEDQARLVWSNIKNQLEAANMTLDNLVKHTTYLSDRKYRDSNSLVRQEILQERKPALTVVIAEIYDPAWLLEIEAIAVD